MTNPTLIFVPGAWHTASCYDILVAKLRPHFASIQTLTLPSVGGASPNIVTSMDPDIACIRTAIASAVEDKAEDVWLAMHSYGGIPGSEAVSGLAADERKKAGKMGGVSKLVYIAAFVVPEAQSLLSFVGGKPSSFIQPSGFDDGNLIVTPENAIKAFYHDITDERQLKETLGQLKPHAAVSFGQPITYAAWKYIPSIYLLTERDEAVPAALQEKMIAQKAGWLEGKDGWKVVKLDSGHSPFLNLPNEITEVLIDAIGKIRRQ